MRRTSSLGQLSGKSASVALSAGTAPTEEPSRRRQSYAEWHEGVTILFADIVGYTAIADRSPPDRVMALLNELYTKFDDLTTELNLYKVETIGEEAASASSLAVQCLLPLLLQAPSIRTVARLLPRLTRATQTT